MNSAAVATTSSRERLLDAAETLVAASGAAQLTLDAVAQAAGVSKGGLLYHFPSKDALLRGMLERHLARVDERVAARLAPGAEAAGNPLLAHVLAMLEWQPHERAVGAAILAASATNPALMQPCRDHYARTVERLAGLPGGFERVALVLLAVDGLLLGELTHLSPFDAACRERVLAALVASARDAVRTDPLAGVPT